jgi:FG-GAP-like repeat
MKRKMILAAFAILAFASAAVFLNVASARSTNAPSALLLTDDFNYTVGTLLTANGWTAHSGGGTNAQTVTSPGLTYVGYPGSGIGNAVTLNTTGEDDNRSLSSSPTSGTVYAAAMVNITSCQTTGDYFFHLMQSSTVFYGRVFLKKDAASANCAFGIVKTSPGVAVYTPFSYAPGTTHLVVVKYTFNSGSATDDTVDLFIDPALGGAEPTPTLTADNTTTALTDATSFTAIGLRQGSATAAPVVIIDGIRVGTSWADVGGGAVAVVKSRADFDGDGKTDVSVFRGADGTWYLNNSTTGFNAVKFGASGDIVVPGDYDADGKADYAVFRASDTSGAPDFYVLNSNGNTFSSYSLGSTGDIPVAGDYDGDGKSDFAVFRPSIGYWFVNNSSTGTTSNIQFGSAGDQPFTMDNDGDGKSNLAVFRPSNGTWYIARPTGTPGANFDAIPFGVASDVPVPADYDGDNKDDVAVFRPSNGTWYILRSSDSQVSYQQFGASGDVAVPGDYDGDGKDDVAVYRNGVWYINRSSSGFSTVNFGVSSDVPVPARYHP